MKLLLNLLSLFYKPINIVFYIAFIFFLFINPVQIIPDIFNLSKSKEINSLLLIFIGSNASAIGMFISVFIISFTIMNNSTRNYSVDYLLSNPQIKLLGNLFILSTITALLTYIVNQRYTQKENINLIYFSIIIFSLFMLLLIPLAVSILKNTNSLASINKTIESISLSDLKQLLETEPSSLFEYFSSIEKNNILILREITINSILSNDGQLPQFIIQKTLAEIEKKNELMPDSIYKYRDYSRIIEAFLNKIIEVSIEKKSDAPMYAALLAFKIQFTNISIKNIDIGIYENLIDFYRRIVSSIIANSRNSIIPILFNFHRQTVIDLMKNDVLPAEESIPIFKSIYGTKYIESKLFTRNWEIFTEKFIGTYQRIGEIAINNRDTDIIKKTLWNIENVISDIDTSKKLTVNQKDYIIGHLTEDGVFIIHKLLDNKLIESIFLYDFFDSLPIVDYITENKQYGKNLLYRYGLKLIEWNNMNALDSYSLGNIFKIASLGIKKIENHYLWQESICYILNIANELYKVYEKDLTNKKSHYYVLYTNIKYLNDYVKENKIEHKKISKKIDNIFKKFKNISDIKKQMIESYIQWK